MVVFSPFTYLLYFTGPIELLGILSKGSMVQNSTSWPFAPYEFLIDYVADTKDPIIPVQGAPIVPTKTLSEVNGTQYDLILVPGGAQNLAVLKFPHFYLRWPNRCFRFGFTTPIHFPNHRELREDSDARSPVPALSLHGCLDLS